MQGKNHYDWRLVAAGLVAAGGVVALWVFSPGTYLPLVALALAGLGFLAFALRFPEALLVACVFMPQWKTAWPLDRLRGIGDLTVAMLIGLAAGIFWRVLRHVGRLERTSLSHVFRGQWHILVTYGMFCTVLLASYTYTTSPGYGGAKLARFLLIGTLYLFSGLLLIRGEKEFRRLCLFFVLASCATAAQMIFHLQHRVLSSETDITRIGAGWLVGMGILILLVYPVVEQSWLRTVTIVAALPLLAGGLIASAARGPIISLAVILPLTLVWFGRFRLSMGRIAVVAVLVASVLGSFVYLRRSDPEKFNAKVGEMVQMSRGGKGSGSASKRLDYYSRTLSAIPDNFWLGQGIGSWSMFYYGRDIREYPHNLFLEVTFEEGILGQLLLIAFLCLVAVSTRHMLRKTQFHFSIVAGLLAYVVAVSMFSGDLDDNRILWLWAGVAMAVCRNAYYARPGLLPVHRVVSPPAERTAYSHSHA